MPVDGDLFRSVTAPFREPHLIVDPEDGRILAANDAGTSLLRLTEGNRSLLALSGDEKRLRTYLRTCSKTSSLLPGTIRLSGPDGSLRRFRCEGARVQLGDKGAAVVLRVRTHEDAVQRFLLLSGKIEELNREIIQRRRAEGDLKNQAAQLEELAVELELTIEQLQLQKDEALEARTAAERASRAKSDFLAVMSHELRTPLNAIIGNVDLLDAEVGGPLTKAQRDQLVRVRRSALHLRDVIEQILVFSRANAGYTVIETEQVDVAHLVRDTTELMMHDAEQRNLSITVRVPAAPLIVETDPSRFNQILINLVSNGLKFTRTGGVTVGLEAQPDERFALIVEDTGIGIAANDLDRIFEPFTQLDSSRTRRAGGTGMGLAVSRQLAELLGGTLSVMSTPGQGSRFTLQLPMSPVREPLRTESRQESV